MAVVRGPNVAKSRGKKVVGGSKKSSKTEGKANGLLNLLRAMVMTILFCCEILPTAGCCVLVLVCCLKIKIVSEDFGEFCVENAESNGFL